MKTILMLWALATEEESNRFRVLLFWGGLSVISSLVLSYMMNKWQVHVPEMPQGNQGRPLLSMLLSGSILPVIFVFTNGLRGYHSVFNACVEAIYNRFYMKSDLQMAEQYGEKEGTKKKERVIVMKYMAGFLFLEVVIIAFGVIGYFAWGRLQGLSAFVFTGDDLFLGAFVFVTEGVFIMLDGLRAAPSVFSLKAIPEADDKKELDNVVESTT